MAKGFPQLRTGVFLLMVFIGVAFSGVIDPAAARPFHLALAFTEAAVSAAKPQIPEGLEGVWDTTKYISVDEIQPGMEAYCLTVYEGAEAEKFGLEVLSVVRDFMPGRDAILVRGTDERFIHTGPVGGCSGSPVYIEGRLAGALAFGWRYSKDPLYGVTPIADMLWVGQAPSGQGGGVPLTAGPGFSFDFSSPLDFSRIEKEISSALSSARRDFSSTTALPTPLVVSGVPEPVRADLDGLLGPLGFMVVSGGGGAKADVCDIKLVSGACLAVPLVDGDIIFDVVGTVTEVIGGEVYGFGHSLLGYGAVDLPMATGHVHTVVSSVRRSFKVATSANIVGALNLDESTAVRGKLGAKARMVPLKISINRYNDSQPRQYNCRIVDNRLLTPLLLRASIASAVLMRGSLPPDNTLHYKGIIQLDGADPVAFENVSTAEELTEIVRDSISPVALLMNNPYRQVKIKSFDFDVQVSEKNIKAAVWSVEVSQSKVKPGERLDVDVVIERFQSHKQKYTFNFVVPENTPADTYHLVVCGGYDYEEFLREAVPHRFVTENLETLVGAINDILAIGRDELHCILVLPSGGVVLEKAELPELPATKALVLGDAKRAIKMKAFPGWIEKKVRTGAVIVDSKVMSVTVEQ
jgi:hypothetical protein